MKKKPTNPLKNVTFKKYPIYYLSFFLLFFFLIMSVTNRFLFAPKILLLCIIILVAIFLGKAKILFRDWFFFFAFIYFFDSMRGIIYLLICKFNLPVYIKYVINLDKAIFGDVPSVILQQTLLKEEGFTWLEKSLTLIHGTHFVAFLFVGLIIWLYKSEYFSLYKISFYLSTLIGVSFYFIIPTAPPWIASNVFHLLPELIHFNTLIYNTSIPDITSGFTTNPIGAMPSLHTCFPVLCSFLLWRIYQWKALPFYLYSIVMLFTIVYTGDHYIVDIMAGIFLAGICYFLAVWLGKKQQNHHLQKQKEKTKGFIKKNLRALSGVLVLVIGISIGLYNKHHFDNYPDQFDFQFAPNYSDFIKHQEKYQDNYYIQMYYGGHFIYKNQHKKALAYFEQALSIAPGFIERKQSELKIRQCKLLIEKTDT